MRGYCWLPSCGRVSGSCLRDSDLIIGVLLLLGKPGRGIFRGKVFDLIGISIGMGVVFVR